MTQDNSWIEQAISSIDAELANGDLVKCPLSGLYRAIGRWGREGFAIRRACVHEKGNFQSWTARRILVENNKVLIGAYSYGDCFVKYFPPKTQIGRYVSIAEGVRAFSRNHPITRISTHPYFFNETLSESAVEVQFNELKIEHDSWLGANSIITPSCNRIGIGAIVGAGAVVTKDVGDFEIVVGNPARIIKRRFTDAVCEKILDSRWWEIPFEKLKDKSSEFGQELMSVDSAQDVLSRITPCNT